MNVAALRLFGFRSEYAAAIALLRRALVQAGVECTVGFGSDGGEVTLLPASLVRPALLVRLPGPFIDDEASRQRALSALAWEGSDETEPWRHLSAPLGGLPRLGRPDERLPWVLTHGTVALPVTRAVARELGAQVHVLSSNPLDWAAHRDVVVWPALPAVAFALLGRAAHVVAGADDDPLFLDAKRVGIPTTGESRLLSLVEGLVPPSLLAHAPLWEEVASLVHVSRRGQLAPALFTPRWIDVGRRLSRASAPVNKVGSPFRLALRRYAKFRREPDRYFADSRYPALRALGRWWFRDPG